MEFRQLKYFVRIVDMGSLSRASQSLHVAQPALSQQLSRLEEDLGVKLLNRSVRGVTPTDSGRAFYDQAQVILKQMDAARLSAIQANAGPAGTVAVGLPWTISNLLGLGLLSEVREHFAAIHLEIIEGPSSVLSGLLAAGKLDLAMLFNDNVNSGLVMEPLLSEPLLFVGPRGSIEAGKVISFSEIAQLPLLLLSAPNGIREQIDQRFKKEGLEPKVVAQINAPRLLQRAIGQGLGYSILPSSGVEQWKGPRQLDMATISGPALERTVVLATSRLFSLSPAAECVMQTLRRLVREAIERKRWHGRPLGPDAGP